MFRKEAVLPKCSPARSIDASAEGPRPSRPSVVGFRRTFVRIPAWPEGPWEVPCDFTPRVAAGNGRLHRGASLVVQPGAGPADAEANLERGRHTRLDVVSRAIPQRDVHGN